MVIIVFGLPGSGKSHFATRLAKSIRAIYYNTDAIRLELYPDKRSYTVEEKKTVYREMAARATTALKDSGMVILDGTFHRHDTRELLAGLLPAGTPVKFIEVTAPEATAMERVSRPRKLTEAGPGVYYKIKQEWEPLGDPHLVLDSLKHVDEMLGEATRYLTQGEKPVS